MRSLRRLLKPLAQLHRKIGAAVPWRWLPLSSRQFGAPKGLWPSTRDYLASAPAHPAGRTHLIEPVQELVRSLPHAIDEHMLEHFRSALRQSPLPREVHELHEVRFWGDYAGTVIGRDDRVLGDLTRDIWGVRHHRIFTRLKLPPCRRLPGVTALLSAAEAEHNYYHWTFDVLSRLDLLERAGFPLDRIDHFVVNHRDRPFQRETLTALGIPWEKLVKADSQLHLELDRALVTRADEHMYAVSASTCNFLNRQVSPAPPLARTRHLYVARDDATFRRLQNQDEIWPILAKRGFERIDPSAHPVAEQRQLFSEAVAVLGVHGAGLTNLVYCQPGTQVLELFAPRYVDLSYWCFTGHLDLEHWIWVDPSAPLVTEKPDATGLRDDLRVDPGQLIATLDAMGL